MLADHKVVSYLIVRPDKLDDNRVSRIRSRNIRRNRSRNTSRNKLNLIKLKHNLIPLTRPSSYYKVCS